MDDFFRTIRDMIIMLSGSWSANQVLEIAHVLGVRGKRSVLLRDINAACGKATNKGGPKRFLTSSQLVPGTSSQLVPEKEKKEAKKRKPSIPQDTTYPLPPNGRFSVAELVPETMPDFGDLEPDVLDFLANAASEAKSRTLTVAGIATRRRALYDLLAELGHEAFRQGIRAANHAGAPNINYVKKAAVTGSRVAQLTGSQSVPAARNGSLFESETIRRLREQQED